MIVQSRGWDIVEPGIGAQQIKILMDPKENNLVQMYGPLGQQCSYVYIFQNSNSKEHIIVAMYEKTSMQTLVFKNGHVEFNDISTKALRKGLVRFFCSRPNYKVVAKQLKLKDAKLVSQSNNRSVIGLLQQLQDINTQNQFTHKAGVLLQTQGQITEEQLFNNISGSQFYEQFLKILGDHVEINPDFSGYLGGLDQQGRESATSIYKTYQSHRIMYHVGTLMRQVKGDEQQVGKKRHIGNDNVIIVFQENDSPEYCCDIIKSNMIFVVIVVRNMSSTFDESSVKYKISITKKSFVKSDGLKLDIKYAEGYTMTPEQASELIFRLVVKTMSLCWQSGELQVKLNRLKQLKIDEWQ